VAALRRLGFDYVFDTDFSADLTVMEEGAELLGRLKAAWREGDQQRQEQDQRQGEGQQGPEQQEQQEQQGHAPEPGPLPLLTSCCPAWVSEVELAYPRLLPHLSSCRSPQQMMGAVVKRVWAKQVRHGAAGAAPTHTLGGGASSRPWVRRPPQMSSKPARPDNLLPPPNPSPPPANPPQRGLRPEHVSLVSFMPCVAKKHEARRPQLAPPAGGGPDVDHVLTTRELGELLRQARLPLASLPQEQFDSPLGASSGAGVLFGASGEPAGPSSPPPAPPPPRLAATPACSSQLRPRARCRSGRHCLPGRSRRRADPWAHAAAACRRGDGGGAAHGV
jgi:NADH-quinone oxidoreductase subunit G